MGRKQVTLTQHVDAVLCVNGFEQYVDVTEGPVRRIVIRLAFHVLARTGADERALILAKIANRLESNGLIVKRSADHLEVSE